ncbi:ABC-2 type transport system permease protein [Ferrimonas sediminum]|uniref:Transport permease protein n=1 Tax=Ferrimonas sediminum TaxID=718193 RepID=A0A1G8RXW5_9GAMM|nr:ABC transporter permease [Ferrimonas sediminum]SDJ21772.1 ABC-2 type transport system permease protein [Ferrimonas sediminum]
MNALLALIHARNLEFGRDKSALGWSLLFPLVLVIALTLVFDDDDKPLYQIGIVGPQSAVSALRDLRHIELIPYADSALAKHKVARHLVDLAIEGDRYWVNPDSARGYIVEQLLLARAPNLTKQTIQGQAVRHVEWLLPGIIGMNMMFSALYGVGYVVVRYRRTGVLRRMQVTPLKPWQFLTSQLLSRLGTIVATSAVVFTLVCLLFSIPIVGNPLLLLLTTTLGSAAMISLGLLVASKTRSEEFSNGMLNLFSWPMMLLSGIWFSLEGSQPWVRTLADLLPLTHMNDANRAVIIDGAGLGAIAHHLWPLALFTLLAMALASWRFRWN